MSTPRLAWSAFATLCLLALGAPGFPAVAAAAPPLVLGLPFALVWNLGWVAAAFVGLAVLDVADGEDR